MQVGAGTGAHLHLTIVFVHVEEVAALLLLSVFLRIQLVDARAVVVGISPEGDVELLQELVHAFSGRRWWAKERREQGKWVLR